MSIYNIYAIDERINSLIDSETGEICEFDLLLELNMERDYLIEQTALTIKNYDLAAKTIKGEIDKLAEKQAAASRQSAKLRESLLQYLGDEKLVTPLVTVSSRKSSLLELAPEDTEEFIVWAETYNNDLLRYKAAEIDKTAVKNAIERGDFVPFATVIKRKSLQIK